MSLYYFVLKHNFWIVNLLYNLIFDQNQFLLVCGENIFIICVIYNYKNIIKFYIFIYINIHDWIFSKLVLCIY